MKNTPRSEDAKPKEFPIAPSSSTGSAPETGDEVQVAFSHGDTRAPYVTGELWNGNSRPPETKGK